MTANAATQTAWHVAYTKPRQEGIAKINLERQDFEVYLPLFKTFKKPRKTAGGTAQSEALLAHEPMFPRYVFFKPKSATQSLGTLRSTRGVASVVMFGTKFAQVPIELLQSIRAAEQLRNEAGLDQVSPYQPGSRVRLSDPALAGLEGLVQEVSAKRVVLLLEILGRQKTLKVDFDQIEAV
ncbi:transcription termination/antitermination protein NusG [Pollutimonas sp. M17]|uniref:transcription termination/antitermination protein NusG n=1 Tax=Pollutimonas sp. M17 TaxID=2962065 RepID=UPI0021F43DB5|nr:transcriptional activator RfaH [Pollutimonas sp. M17]UYO93933.1 transcriptional activator RfaH [Pollutimonas sp. M17]